MENNELLNICKQKHNKSIDKSWDDLALEFNFKSGETLRCWFKSYRKANGELKKNKEIEVTEKFQYKETTEIHKDGSQSSDKLLKMSEDDSKDVNYLLKSHGYDIKAWELVSARNNIWNVYSKQDGVQVLYSSKIVVKPRVDYCWNEKDILKIFNNIKTNCKNEVNIISKQHTLNGNLLVVPIADLHYGLFSDKYSTGNDYNIKIAEELFYTVINNIIDRVKNKKFEKVLFIVGNDFINADNINGTTTKCTPQDNDGLWFNTVNKATQMIINGIDMLNSIAPVDVVYVLSNHDLHTMFGIMQTIKAWYRNNKNIKIDDSPMPRKYYKFGKNILGLSHDIKVKDALPLITSEAKDMWSDCTHMIWMLAHLHQAMIYEKQGYLEIMRLPTVSGWSRWSNNMGYFQSEKKNQSFIMDEYMGITDVINTIII